MSQPIPEADVTQLPAELPSDLVVLDVREDDEWRAGHIEDALHIPLMQVPQRLSELPEGQLLVVCKMGGRSARATALLQAQGRAAVNLAGGMLAWERAQRPMVTDTGVPAQVV
ncbi:MAG: rhodanese-like domain-containing protein [Nocardioidaceae bacterium]|nr:rhodanese-like domain-containing protein [Nocardioidaceae bacterium]